MFCIRALIIFMANAVNLKSTETTMSYVTVDCRRHLCAVLFAASGVAYDNEEAADDPSTQKYRV